MNMSTTITMRFALSQPLLGLLQQQDESFAEVYLDEDELVVSFYDGCPDEDICDLDCENCVLAPMEDL